MKHYTKSTRGRVIKASASRNNGKRKRRASRNNGKRKRRAEDRLNHHYIHNMGGGSQAPICITVMTPSQVHRIKESSLFVKLSDKTLLEKDGPTYTHVSSGCYFKKGHNAVRAILCDLDSFIHPPPGHYFCSVNFLFRRAISDAKQAAELKERHYVLLALAVDSGSKNFHMKVPDFDTINTLPRLKKLKKTIISSDGSKHHGSKGQYYGFGYKGGSEPATLENTYSSVHPYSTRKKDPPILEICELDRIENDVVRVIEHGISCIDRVFRGTRGTLITRSGTSMVKSLVKACHMVNGNLQDNIDFVGNTYFTSTFANVNATTEVKHTERDIAYTFIGVPTQPGLKKNQRSPYCFEFYTKGSREKSIDIRLNVGTCLWFHGFLLTHRQQCKAPKSVIPFVNHSAYANQRLYNHGRLTVARNSITDK